MTFNNALLEFQPLETKTINGKRHYHVDGEYFPSVTTVLSGEDKPQLEAWKKRVGEVEAAKISRAAANRGEGMHTLLEAYLLNKDMTDLFRKAMPTHVELFHKIRPLLDKHVTNVYAIEAPLYSKALGVAGRVDVSADWDGSPAIIDFKSSTRPKQEKWMTGYYMQESLYSFMLYEMHRLHVPKLVTLVAVENYPHADVFEQRAAKWLGPALELVEKFYEKAAANPTEAIK